MINKVCAAAVLLLIFNFLYAQQKQQTIITGDEMLIRKIEGITVVKGNGQVLRGSQTIKADTITYSENQNNIDASGKVSFFDRYDDGSLIKAFSENASYNTENSSGKLWGGNPVIEYNLKKSTDVVYLYADTFYLDKGFDSARAEANVKIISSSGTITSDNAKLDKKTNTLFMQKDKNRPKITAYQQDKYAEFESDELYLFYDTKTVKMDKDVKGKFIMKDSQGKQ